MSPRELQYGTSLDAIWEELVYTEAQILNDANASDLASPIGALIDRVHAVRSGQLGAWRAEIHAQARVDTAGEALGAAITAIADDLSRAGDRDRRSPRWRRYFGTRSSADVRRLGLERQLRIVRSWPGSLATEPEAALQAHADALTSAVATGDDAVAARADAAAARRDHRARDIAALVDAANAARLDLYGRLTRRASTRKLDRRWPSRFFRKSAARVATSEPAPLDDPAPTPAA